MPERLKKTIAGLFDRAINTGVFPGTAAGISCGTGENRKRLLMAAGHASLLPEQRLMTDRIFFDLASLTKVVTALAVLCLLKQNKLLLDSPLAELLEMDVPAEKEGIRLWHLLNHCSGLPGHVPYYQKLVGFPPLERRAALISWVLNEPMLYIPGTRALYSDLGFMILAWAVEIKSGLRFDHFVRERIMKPLGLEEGLFFQPLTDGGRAKDRRLFAATEKCPWRGKVLEGEVHDDNAYAMGGIAGHAGLFGNAESVLRLTEHLLDQWLGHETPPGYSAADLKKFLVRQNRVKESTWALGFDTPSGKNSSGGRFLSPESAGHLGFTGCSFWMDPEKELLIVLLSNRVHPRRDNYKIREFRPLFHDSVISGLCG